jgi:F0F1-type ATP synthase assembly protein I
MDKLFIAIGAMLLIPIILIFSALLQIGAGILVGLLVGVVLDDTWAKLMNTTGWALEAWQTGGLLAFVGAFFKPTGNFNSKSE